MICRRPIIPGKIEEESSISSQQDSQEATDAANNLSQASALQQQLSSATSESPRQ